MIATLKERPTTVQGKETQTKPGADGGLSADAAAVPEFFPDGNLPTGDELRLGALLKKIEERSLTPKDLRAVREMAEAIDKMPGAREKIIGIISDIAQNPDCEMRLRVFAAHILSELFSKGQLANATGETSPSPKSGFRDILRRFGLMASTVAITAGNALAQTPVYQTKSPELDVIDDAISWGAKALIIGVVGWFLYTSLPRKGIKAAQWQGIFKWLEGTNEAWKHLAIQAKEELKGVLVHRVQKVEHAISAIEREIERRQRVLHGEEKPSPSWYAKRHNLTGMSEAVLQRFLESQRELKSAFESELRRVEAMPSAEHVPFALLPFPKGLKPFQNHWIPYNSPSRELAQMIRLTEPGDPNAPRIKCANGDEIRLDREEIEKAEAILAEEGFTPENLKALFTFPPRFQRLAGSRELSHVLLASIYETAVDLVAQIGVGGSFNSREERENAQLVFARQISGTFRSEDLSRVAMSHLPFYRVAVAAVQFLALNRELNSGLKTKQRNGQVWCTEHRVWNRFIRVSEIERHAENMLYKIVKEGHRNYPELTQFLSHFAALAGIVDTLAWYKGPTYFLNWVPPMALSEPQQVCTDPDRLFSFAEYLQRQPPQQVHHLLTLMGLAPKAGNR
ncbi:MAG: hypothetical protein D6808_05350 [Candidatus Dadabacteria bacterium]|nr:MAG: hypothetical protein D6808_05350 [Candidatus Dadabacteria bacterium]